MNLINYIKESGGTKTFYHLMKRNRNPRLEYQIGLDTENNKKLASEIQRLAYEKENSDLFIFNTPMADYIDVGDEKVIDISVFSLSEEKAREQFEHELEKSRNIRQRLLKYLEHDVKPSLVRIGNMKEEIVGLLFRGDLNDPERFPNELSNIDITCLTKFPHYENDKKERLIKNLSKVHGSFMYSYWEFDYEKPSFYAKSNFLERVEEKILMSIMI